MEIEITLQNYRCFGDEPARFTVGDGWTAFIGVNNVGKSAAMRFLYEFRTLFSHLSHLQNLANLFDGSQAPSTLFNNLSDIDEIFHHGNTRALQFSLRDTTSPGGNELSFDIERGSRMPRLIEINGIHGTNGPRPFGTRSQIDTDNWRFGDGTLFNYAKQMKVFKTLVNTLYIGAFRNIANTGGQQYFDLQIGESFIRQWGQMQTGATRASNNASIEVVKTIERLLGCGSLTIQPTPDNKTLHLTIDDKPYKLMELGAGVAQLILVLASAAARKPSFILIDEPEQSLHPSLQLDFLSALGKLASEDVVFSTHNIGLARSCAERIYSVTRERGKASRVHRFEATPQLPAFLGEMSYSSYQALGFEKVLLVEGPTEVKTFQQFLRMQGKDHKIVILQLGGSSMINGERAAELQEVARITGELIAVIDSEKSSADIALPSDRERFKAVCASLNIKCHILERRATDNYLTTAAIQKVKASEKYKALEAYERLADARHGWSKSDNWRIAAEMKWEDIAGTDLGAIIEQL